MSVPKRPSAPLTIRSAGRGRRGRRGAGKPPRPRPRHLPAAAGRPRAGRRAHRPGQQVPLPV